MSKLARICLLALVAVQVSAQEEPAQLNTVLDIDVLYSPISSLPVHGEAVARLAERLQRFHYNPVAIDDGFSSQVFDRYLDILDGSRMHFLQHEVDGYDAAYRYAIDDSIKSLSVAPGFQLYNDFQRRRLQRLIYAINRVENHIPEMDFTLDESYQDREDAPYPADLDELHEVWRLWVKSAVLGLKLAGDDDAEIEEKLSRRYRNQLSSVLKANERDVVQSYLSAVARVTDPHTDYFSPRNAENFNMSMSLSLEGIGAQLGLEDEYTKVMAVIPGGPAARGGELQAEDRITGVAQGAEGEFMDVIGMRLDDVVDQIRGEKGTLVRLEVIPADAVDDRTRAVIHITRDVVKLVEDAASKEIIELSYNGVPYRIGVIDLPQFYLDFVGASRGLPDYNSATRDVRVLLQELEAEGVDGVIMDLRDNSGGSLAEANDMVGLFIETGPTVQIRKPQRRGGGFHFIDPLYDRNPEVAYAGPLAVLVARTSASSSEIFAGAIQDYQRGIVLGGQTFGKGTVQELLQMQHRGVDYGQVKITRSQYYRISGASTQSRGVMPDILLPDIRSINDDIGESALDGALPWDEIQPLEYALYQPIQALLPELQARHEARAAELPDLVYLDGLVQRSRAQRQQRLFSLNEDVVREQRRERRLAEFNADNQRREAKGLEPRQWVEDEADEGSDVVTEVEGDAEIDSAAIDLDSASEIIPTEPVAPTAAETVAEAEDAEEAEEAAEEEDEPDPLLLETGRVLADYIELTGPRGYETSEVRGF